MDRAHRHVDASLAQHDDAPPRGAGSPSRNRTIDCVSVGIDASLHFAWRPRQSYSGTIHTPSIVNSTDSPLSMSKNSFCGGPPTIRITTPAPSKEDVTSSG